MLKSISLFYVFRKVINYSRESNHPFLFKNFYDKETLNKIEYLKSGKVTNFNCKFRLNFGVTRKKLLYRKILNL